MTRRTPVAVIAALIAAPAAASAATVVGGPVRIGAQQVMLTAVDGPKDSLTISATRGAPARMQIDSLTYTRGVRVVVRGRTATITGSLGSRGTVNLRLTGARLISRPKAPVGCTWTVRSAYAGRLTGILRVRIGGARPVLRSLPATAMGASRITCRGAGDGTGGGGGDGPTGGGEPQLMWSRHDTAANETVMFTATRSQLGFLRSSSVTEGAIAYSAVTSVIATGANLLTITGGGAHASVPAIGAFTGSGQFTADSVTPTIATGSLGGQRIRPVGLPAYAIGGDDAMLMNPNG